MSSKMERSIASIEDLRGAFVYDADTGKLYRRDTMREVGTTRSHGYLVCCYKYRMYRVHRLVWALQTGKWPVTGIDHINRIPSDNRWSNLREADQSQNMANTGVTRRSASGVKGVSWDKMRNKWAVYIGKDRKCINAGRYDSLEEAIEAWQEKHKALHGEFSSC